MNSVQLVGRVGQDPQIFGEGSKRVARVSLATTERGFVKKDGTKVEDAIKEAEEKVNKKLLENAMKTE